MTNLLLFVGLLTMALLVEAIRYWQAFRLHDLATTKAMEHEHYLELDEIVQRSGRSFRGIEDWKNQQYEQARKEGFILDPDGTHRSIHPDLIEVDLTEIERRIIADAMYRGEDLPGVGPSFVD
jgi:hypothetical protein